MDELHAETLESEQNVTHVPDVLVTHLPDRSADVYGQDLRPLASHGNPLRHSKILHRCDTRRRARSADHKRLRRQVF